MIIIHIIFAPCEKNDNPTIILVKIIMYFSG